MRIKTLALLALGAGALGATPALAGEGATLLSDSEMDAVVAGELVPIASVKYLRVPNAKGENAPFRFIDFSDKPDQAAAVLFNSGVPESNGTVVIDIHDQPVPGVIYRDVDGTLVGAPSGPGHGAAFYTATISIDVP